MNVPTNEISVNNLPEDSASLKAMLREVLAKLESVSTDQQREKRLAEQLRQRADDLYLENLRLQQELERYKKATYGPRADRLSMNQLAQMLLEFAEALEQKPINLEDLREAEPGTEVRRVKRRKGRRALANFENLPVKTYVYELRVEERPCPSCGVERKEIGGEKSWQIEYIPGHFERLEHVRKKYACPSCESAGENPQIEVAAKAETAIEKGFAGPGLLAFIVTSKFADYLPLYRLEDIFERQGFEISRATQSVWCGDVADVVEPLYQRMAERVRKSHVVATDDTVQPMLSPGQTQPARMWVYVGDEANPYNVFDFTLNRSREGPKEFLKDYTQVLLADAYGGYNGVVAGNAITRAGCWSHARRKFVEAEKSAPEIAREAVALMDALFAVERQAKDISVSERLELRQKQSVPILAELHRKLLIWKEQLLPKHFMADAVNYTLGQWEALTVFTSDGAVPIDNNVSEREMKRVVLNRKNSLFVGNPRGGRTAAILASLTSSCRRHDMDPHLYFMQLLVNLPTWPARDLDAWLPDRWKQTHIARCAALGIPVPPNP
ncbi:MAG TPA: IS66 family transposase [Candidatus Polarisedimenticolia bacterium]|nr:IS66 family transposase [Candidatus Polarisedimenticolia bacterium]